MEVVLPALLTSTPSWPWKMFSRVCHQSWKVFVSPPCSHLLFVLFQTHPQLKFSLKVSNFHSFSKQLCRSFGNQMLILCTEE